MNMCCKMINAAFVKKSKYRYSLTVTVALLLLRLCCNLGSRYLKFVGFFSVDKDRIQTSLFLHGYMNLLLCAVCFLLEEFRCLPVSFR